MLPVALPTVLPRYCSPRMSTFKCSSCLHCSTWPPLTQTHKVACSSRVTPGPHVLQSTWRKVGFIVFSTTSETYTGSTCTISLRFPGPKPRGTYRPSMPGTCSVKKTSAIRPFIAASSFSCRFCGVALAHSNVLRLRNGLNSGLRGAIGAASCFFL